jgi:hypothetical protein
MPIEDFRKFIDKGEPWVSRDNFLDGAIYHQKNTPALLKNTRTGAYFDLSRNNFLKDDARGRSLAALDILDGESAGTLVKLNKETMKALMKSNKDQIFEYLKSNTVSTEEQVKLVHRILVTHEWGKLKEGEKEAIVSNAKRAIGSASWRDVGLPQRYYDSKEYRANKGTILLFALGRQGINMNKPYISENGGEINIDSMYSRLNHKTKEPVLLDVQTLSLVYQQDRGDVKQQDRGDVKQQTGLNLDDGDDSDPDSADSDDEFIDSDESSF